MKYRHLLGKYLSGSQAIADCETVDGDLDLALVDHVYDGLGGRVHRDDWHGEGSVIICGLLAVALHLGKKVSWSSMRSP